MNSSLAQAVWVSTDLLDDAVEVRPYLLHMGQREWTAMVYGETTTPVMALLERGTNEWDRKPYVEECDCDCCDH